MKHLCLSLLLALGACDAGAPATDHPDAAMPGAVDAATPTTDAGPVGPRIDCAMPILSRHRPTAASHGDAAGLVDGAYAGLTWTGAPGDWVAIDVGAGPSQVMLAWIALGDSAPASYRIETSADSTNGRDGAWGNPVVITGNVEPTRADLVRFTGQRWLRLQIVTGTPELGELSVHDASGGTCDSWLFIGDSITALAYNFSSDFSDDVHAARPTSYPLRVAIGVGGTNSQDGLDHLDYLLASYPDVTNWVVSYGTNDTGGGDPVFAPAYGDRMLQLVTRLKQAGKRVFVPHIPYNTGDVGHPVIPTYNAQVDRVVTTAGIEAGPDLYAYFAAHPGQLADGTHPDGDGSQAMNLLWSQVALRYYP